MVHPTKELMKPFLNNLQRGFCAGSSSVNTALLISEACAESKDNNTPIFAAFLDASKAFDVVWHQGMFLKLENLGITDDLWLLYQDLYKGMSSVVKCEGAYSSDFTETQGVRQGGIPSTELFKARGDALLHRIEQSQLGLTVGSIDVSVPTCADDMILLSSSPINLQAMLNLAAQDAAWERYQFSNKKTKTLVTKTRSRSEHHVEGCWTLNEKLLQTTTEELHLGLVRTADGKMTATVKNNITKARRALYALTGSGMHGLNGVHPAVGMKLWNSYILPRLIYGLEQTKCTAADMETMERFQRATLRRIQHLPERTANCVTLLMLGEIPIQAYVDKQTLTFFGSIVSAPESRECQLVHRQLAVKDSVSSSWVVHVATLLRQYDLPSPHHLLANPPGKSSRGWKMQVKHAIGSFWTKQLLSEASHRITARFMSRGTVRQGNLHPVWDLTPFDSFDILQASIKAKMLAGSYWLGIDEGKRGERCKMICQLCRDAVEDLEHMLLDCVEYSPIRRQYLPRIQETFEGLFSREMWLFCSKSRDDLLRVILDVNLVLPPSTVGGPCENYMPLEQVTRKYLFCLHNHRAKKMAPKL